ncbi:MAG: hypothetical protein F6J90_35220 [Moorea sp. SIOASIH]|uniref:hypothetical protein n=1 Tax=Moorena sp. SIOASIH TaxID=2607817 RepID=UPI0013B93938|nr:hypothetical protein [Moorena sp. SIOASIH]NEO41297.1 hypothetical protein [Moorena sp. SIOASIH]
MGSAISQFPKAHCIATPDSRLPIPDSLIPTPDSRFPNPDSRLPQTHNFVPHPIQKCYTTDEHSSLY